MKARIREYLKDVAIKKGKPITVSLLGFGTTNEAILDAISDLDICEKITIRQNNKLCDTPCGKVELICGNKAFDGIYEDVVFPSPSVRREKLHLPTSSVITSDTDIFFGEPRENLFLISGSDGKSTVTTLASLLLFPTFPELFKGGNLGTPLASASLSSSAFVVELSSFNLRYCIPKAKRAILTNVTPNHLNWHANLSEYESCKRKLVESADEPVLALSSAFTANLAKSLSSFALVSDTDTSDNLHSRYDTKHTVTKENGKICIDAVPVIAAELVKCKERHNILNLMSAIALTLNFTSPKRICEVATDFSGLEHRCERFSAGKINCINSSIDTTPERTRATLQSLDLPVNIILGGRGKGLPLDPLKEPLLKYANRISVYGDISDEICSWIDEDSDLSKIPHGRFATLKEAIDYADSDISDKVSILLSPAATGYGEFKSFAQRGCFFKDYLTKKHRKI